MIHFLLVFNPLLNTQIWVTIGPVRWLWLVPVGGTRGYFQFIIIRVVSTWYNWCFVYVDAVIPATHCYLDEWERRTMKFSRRSLKVWMEVRLLELSVPSDWLILESTEINGSLFIIIDDGFYQQSRLLCMIHNLYLFTTKLLLRTWEIRLTRRLVLRLDDQSIFCHWRYFTINRLHLCFLFSLIKLIFNTHNFLQLSRTGARG